MCGLIVFGPYTLQKSSREKQQLIYGFKYIPARKGMYYLDNVPKVFYRKWKPTKLR